MELRSAVPVAVGLPEGQLPQRFGHKRSADLRLVNVHKSVGEDHTNVEDEKGV